MPKMKSTESQLKNIRFVRYGDLVLINESSLPKLGFQQYDLSQLQKNSLAAETLKQRFRCRRIAIKAHIQNDDFRSPNVVILGSDETETDPWVSQVDNGIKYCFNITRSMFCKGNIKEKLRLSKLDCSNEIVVDLFAGIGYFALVFAVHCNAKMVYCCEWNPWAVEALRRNARLNRIEEKIVICEGDNRLVCPVGVANRVNMGLIPTSLDSLEMACRALNLSFSQFWLHVHENLNYLDDHTKDQLDQNRNLIDQARKVWSEGIAQKTLETLVRLHPNTRWSSVEAKEIICIKPYAPHIDHMVVDISILKE